MFERLDRLAEPLLGLLDSPWLWLIVLLVSGLDALLPFMPSESTVVLVAVLIGPDLPLLALLTGVAAAGALAGDCLGYAIGRYAGPRAVARLVRGERGRARYARARARVEQHAALLIVAGRFLPGGRVVSALSTGSVRYPLRRFVVLDAAGASLWALFSSALGGFGGAALTDSPAKGLLLATGIGLVVAGGVAALHRRVVPERGDFGGGAAGGAAADRAGECAPARPGPWPEQRERA
ncbi:DedA family protein [Streptomyces halobius]|uniref:VTT domain-containing protein n=1 Tax=Streptomyces halobius TaxID=2879846 RepID=A0ABY4MFH4_9ACTN|nr:VTT domain-containing protein [Streptomyces halobius]UQA95863.1 VTT domain-containing protein [Streptomyces halobius]